MPRLITRIEPLEPHADYDRFEVTYRPRLRDGTLGEEETEVVAGAEAVRAARAEAGL